MIPYSTSYSLCRSNAQHPHVHRLRTSQDDQCRAGHSPTSPSLGKRCLGGGEDFARSEDSAKHPLQSTSLEDLASHWLVCPQFSLSWLNLGLKEQLQGCPLCAVLRPRFQKLPLCKITISPPCSTLSSLSPPQKTTSSRGSRADAHHRFLYKREEKNPTQLFLLLMGKKMFPVENFLVTHISVSVEKAKHQVALCLLFSCAMGLSA